jgi:hypothetical protein
MYGQACFMSHTVSLHEITWSTWTLLAALTNARISLSNKLHKFHSVSTITRLWGGQLEKQCSIQSRGRHLFFPLQHQDQFWVLPFLCPVGTYGFLSNQWKQCGHETDHLPLSSAEFRSAQSYTSLHSSCLHGMIGNFIFYLYCKYKALGFYVLVLFSFAGHQP